MISSLSQVMSYTCNIGATGTTFFQSYLWEVFWNFKGFETGVISTHKLSARYFKIQTKIAGKGWIFLHAPYCKENLNKECVGISIRNLTKYFQKVISLAKMQDIDFVKFVPMFQDDLKCIKYIKQLGQISIFRSKKDYEYASWHAFIDLTQFQSSDDLLMSFRKSTRYLIRKTMPHFDVEIYNIEELDTESAKKYYNIIKQYMLKNVQFLTWEEFDFLKKHVSKDQDVNIYVASIYKNQNNYKKQNSLKNLNNQNVSNHFNQVDNLGYIQDGNRNRSNLLFLKHYVGGALFIEYKNSMFYLYSGFSKEYPKFGLSHLLLFNMMLFAKKRKVHKFSLWGVNIPNSKYFIQQWQGFSSFKLGFRPQVQKLIGPLIIPISKKGYLAMVRDLIGHYRLKFNGLRRL